MARTGIPGSVRMVVPADRKAKGFHLTGGSTPSRLQKDVRPNPTEQTLLEGGVGLVITVVQEPGTYGQREMAHASEKKFAESLNPRFKIQYWAWPATLMRATTTAYSEKDHFEKGKVAMSGGSKNGASLHGDHSRRADDGRTRHGLSNLGFPAPPQ